LPHATLHGLPDCKQPRHRTNINRWRRTTHHCGTKAASGRSWHNGSVRREWPIAHKNDNCQRELSPACKDTNTQYDPTGKCDVHVAVLRRANLVADDCGAYVVQREGMQHQVCYGCGLQHGQRDYCMGTTCRTLIAGEGCGSSRNCSGSLLVLDGVCCNAASCNELLFVQRDWKGRELQPGSANTTDGTCVSSCTTPLIAVGASCDGAGKCVTSAKPAQGARRVRVAPV